MNHFTEVENEAFDAFIKNTTGDNSQRFQDNDLLLLQDEAELTESIILLKTLRQSQLKVEHIGDMHGRLSVPLPSADIVIPTLIFLRDVAIGISIGVLSAYIYDKLSKKGHHVNVKSKIVIKKRADLFVQKYVGPADEYIGALKHVLKKFYDNNS